MSWTVKQLAIRCNKSERTITKWAARNGISKSGRYWVFSEDDAIRLLSYYGCSELAEQSAEPTEPNSELLERLEHDIELLEEQIKEKDKTISRLLDEAKSKDETIKLMARNAAMLTAADTKDKLLQPIQKPGLWQRIKRAFG